MERSSERSDVPRPVSSHRFATGARDPSRDVVFEEYNDLACGVWAAFCAAAFCADAPICQECSGVGVHDKRMRILPLRSIERELIDGRGGGRGRSRSTPGTGAGRGAGFRDRHADSSPSSSRHRGPGREGGCRAAFAAANEAEVEALLGPGKADAQDFEALEQAVRRQTLAIAALTVARRLNEDHSDHSGSTMACACGQPARYAGRRPKTFTTLLGR